MLNDDGNANKEIKLENPNIDDNEEKNTGYKHQQCEHVWFLLCIISYIFQRHLMCICFFCLSNICFIEFIKGSIFLKFVVLILCLKNLKNRHRPGKSILPPELCHFALHPWAKKNCTVIPKLNKSRHFVLFPAIFTRTKLRGKNVIMLSASHFKAVTMFWLHDDDDDNY